jgi:hypothetical protein
LKNSNNAAGQNDPRASCRVVNHHDVERVAVIGFRRWHEAPVMGIGQSSEERFREDECFQFLVVCELSSAPARRFHDNMHVAIFCKGRQVDEVRHSQGSG